ncbi:crotonase/enoyl-CoA hydratase family protein [Aureimonas mangrovi]|uniref:crotonase/enoyl-CoA hydratase family protein n=1 Tax=Aureimonas mangrovi TaxID=2758041 RepID=UPI00163D4E4E|nr:crotonase/enoyl-CoA hydratase family protein [Aureimonas mangrovi]
MTDTIKTAIADGVMTIALDRPEKKNALDQAMYGKLVSAFEEAACEDAVRVVLVKGVPGSFSAGNDIKDFVTRASGGDAGEETARFLRILAGFRKPLVAAVDGLAIGIGTTMLMHFDLVYSSPASLFRTPFLDLGLVPEAGSSLIAPRLMGHTQAFALLVAGEPFNAERATRANIVTEIVAADALEAHALKAAASLAAKPPEALRIARALVRGDEAGILERIEVEIRHFAERLRSTEAREAFTAFMNRSR